jgi:hypothetical protein
MQFDQAGTIVVPVQWFFTDPDAKVFPGFHLFGPDRDIWEHQLPALGPGEPWNAVRSYEKGEMPAYLKGNGGFCGAEDWWENGVPSDAPPLMYNARGVPGCCPPEPCQPWHQFGPPTRVWKRVLTGEVWTTVLNAPGGYQASTHFGHGALMEAQHTIDPCGLYFFTSITVNITVPPFVQTVTPVLVSYDPGSTTGTWQFPVNPYGYSGEFFTFKNPV